MRLYRTSAVFFAAAATAATAHAADRMIATGWFSNDVMTCHVGGACENLVPAGSGGLGQAHSVTVGPDGLLYVTSIASNEVLRYNATTGDFIDVFIPDGLGTLLNPTKVAFGPADGLVYVTSYGNNRVKVYHPVTGAYLGNRVNALTAAGLNGPESLTFGPDGNIYVASRFTDSVKKYHATTGAFLGDFVTPGLGGLAEPFHMHFSSDGTRFYVGSSTADTVIAYDGATGSLIGELIADDPLTPEDETGGLDNPHDVTIGPDGRMYVTSFDSDEVLVYDPGTGDFIESIGGLDGPQEVVFIESTFVEDDVVVIHTFTGESSGDQFGWVSNKIGDLDGDGVQDLLITAPTNDAGGNNAGRVYAYSSNPASNPGVPLLTLTGTTPNAQFGYVIGDAGDLDDDMIPDIQVGAPLAGNGAVYLHSGSDGSLIDQITGAAPGDRFGLAVCPALDYDGDGKQEILVGAPLADPRGMINAGEVYVYDGDTRNLLFTIPGGAAGESFGSSVAPIADQNGDGVPDILVGAPGAGTGFRGRMYLYSGADQQRLCFAEPGPGGVALGSGFISSPGDVNNDGKADIYVTDFGSNNGRGRLYVYQYDGATCSLLFQVTGAPGDGLGIGNGTAGDVNFDGHADILSGAWISNAGAPLAGKAYIFSGADHSVFRTITSTVAGEAFGFDAHTMCDVTGDGVDDMLITAANNTILGPFTGRAYLIEGRRAGPPCPADLALPLGMLDFSDIIAFLTAFGAMQAPADLAEPLGVFDFSDVLAFLTAFAAGCP